MNVEQTSMRRELPKRLFFIFQGIEEAFEESWGLHERSEDAVWKIKKWNWLVEWIEGWQKLYWSIILGEDFTIGEPLGIVRCIIETLQEYDKFTAEDLVQSLEKLGELANYMYCAGRDYLKCSPFLNPKKYYPLQKYYIAALEQVVWMTATLRQDPEGNFTDLTMKLKQILEA